MKTFIHNFSQFRSLAVRILFLGSILLMAAGKAWAQAPAITSFDPTASIGSSITIYGSNLAGTTGVMFGTTPAITFSSTSTAVTVTVPVGSKIGNLSVTTPGGTATSTTAFTPYVTWIGGNGNWDIASNWSNGFTPDQTTNVVIPTGSPVINNSAFCNNLSNYGGLTLAAGADLIVTGIFQNLSAYNHTGGKITFAAPTGVQQVPALTYYDVTIAGAGTKQLLGNATVNGTLAFVGSNLTTVDPANTTLTLNGTITGETNSHSFIGKLKKSRYIDGPIIDSFGNIGISFNNIGNGTWGNVVATRVSGQAITKGTYRSIERFWDITPDNPNTNTAVTLTLSWLTNEDNGLTFPNGKAQAWRSEDQGTTWLAVDAPKTIATVNGLRSIIVTTENFSKWGISDENNPLPVTWLYFNGKVTDNGNQLRWATASEKNSDSFIVERSANGKTYEAIGTVKAAGNSNQTLAYSFTDLAPAADKMYYRLKQTDLDGAFAYSTVIVVNKTTKGRAFDAVVYPNPFAGTLNLKLDAAAGVKEVSMLSLDGKEVYRKAVSAETNVSLNDIPSLNAGMYILQLHGTNGTTTVKVNRQ